MKNIFKKIKILSFVIVLSVLFIPKTYAAEIIARDTNWQGPAGITVDEKGDIYITDEKNNTIIKLNGNIGENFAGIITPHDQYGKSVGDYFDNENQKSLFNAPSDISSWNGGIIVSDTKNNVIRYIKDGYVSTLAGTTKQGNDNGLADKATFFMPRGLAVDENNNIYIADSGNGSIRKISTDGEVSTYCENLVTPYGLAYFEGVLYGTDAEKNEVFKVVDGKVVVIAGLAEQEEDVWIGDYIDGTTDQAKFYGPKGIEVVTEGIFVADAGNSAVRFIDTDTNEVSTIVKLEQEEDVSWPVTPTGVAVKDGTVYVTDTFSGVVFAATYQQDVVEGTQGNDKTDVAETTSPEMGMSSTTVMGIIAFLVIVLLALGFYIYKKKKTNEE